MKRMLRNVGEVKRKSVSLSFLRKLCEEKQACRSSKTKYRALLSLNTTFYQEPFIRLQLRVSSRPQSIKLTFRSNEASTESKPQSSSRRVN